MEKIRTTIYIDKKLMELAHTEIDNISELITTLLESYLSVNSTECIEKEITEHEKIINTLKLRKNNMLKDGSYNDKKEGMATEINKEFQNLYIKRREQIGNNEELDLVWLMSPKNIQRCKLINKEPLILARELRDWYTNYLVTTQK